MSDVIGGVVITASGIDGDRGRRIALRGPRAVHQKSIKRQPGDLRGGIPERHIEGAYGDASLAVAAWFFIDHHNLPGAERVEVGSGFVHEIGLARGEQARREPLANEAALCEAADRREAITNYWLAVPD